jgi:hypothetical protein
MIQKLIDIYKTHKRKNIVNTFLKQKNKIEIHNILKKEEYLDPFYKKLFNSLLDGIGKKYLTKYIYQKILEEENNKIQNQKSTLSNILKKVENTKI